MLFANRQTGLCSLDSSSRCDLIRIRRLLLQTRIFLTERP